MRKLSPGTWVTIRRDGYELKKGDEAIIFSIEKGKDPWLYAVYSFKKKLWEYFHASDLM